MIKELLNRTLYWWVGHEWVADASEYRMVRRRPDGRTFEFRAMTPHELEEEMQARAW